MSTKLAFEYLISKRNWQILESNIFFCLCRFLCQVWGTRIFLCACLDPFDNFLSCDFRGALQGFDLIKAEPFSHQDASIESKDKWWVHSHKWGWVAYFYKDFPRKSLTLYCIINCYEIGWEHPSPRLPGTVYLRLGGSRLLMLQVACSMFITLRVRERSSRFTSLTLISTVLCIQWVLKTHWVTFCKCES